MVCKKKTSKCWIKFVRIAIFLSLIFLLILIFVPTKGDTWYDNVMKLVAAGLFIWLYWLLVEAEKLDLINIMSKFNFAPSIHEVSYISIPIPEIKQADINNFRAILEAYEKSVWGTKKFAKKAASTLDKVINKYNEQEIRKKQEFEQELEQKQQRELKKQIEEATMDEYRRSYFVKKANDRWKVHEKAILSYFKKENLVVESVSYVSEYKYHVYANLNKYLVIFEDEKIIYLNKVYLTEDCKKI